MSASEKASPLFPVPEGRFDGQVGGLRVQVLGSEDQGTLVLTPPAGEALEIRLEDGRLTLAYSGPEVQITAPDASLDLQARRIGLKADETIEVHAGKEVDIHSRVDVEVRADHHVNLWGFGVQVGD